MKKVRFLGGKLEFKDGGYRIDFSKAPVEDKDLEVLAQVGNLKSLDLRGTRVTDEGLKQLEPIQTLDTVNVQRSGVTREGAEKLRKMLPKANVVF